MGFQVKIVGDFCNIRCGYCRNRDFKQGEKTVMSIEVLEKLLAFLNTSPQQRIRVNWHGGEPLLVGKDFFRNVVMLEKKYPEKTWVNVVQTNATLVDDGWAKFFVDNGFHLGVSVDGSQRVHDIDRVSGAGYGTYKRVIRGVDILRRHGLYPGVICTVTKKTVGYAKEIFSSLVSVGFKNIAFNAFYNTASERSADEYGLSNDDWSWFLREIFESWLEINDETIRVRELDAILAWTQGKASADCSYRGACSQWFAIDYTGDVYPCERFGRNVHFGNVDSIGSCQKLFESETFLSWKSSDRILPGKCKACSFLPLCHNGCSSHRQADEQGVPLYAYCESRLEFYRFVQHTLREVTL